MPPYVEISVTQLARLVGLPGTPSLIDVRYPEQQTAEPWLLPAAQPLSMRDAPQWASRFRAERVIVYCQDGGDISRGVAAWLRQAGCDAQTLEGGFQAWRQAGQPLIRSKSVPVRNDNGQTAWITRARPKIMRIACPWLIRRFIDPHATFLFVPPSDVPATAQRYGATPFDTETGRWNDRGDDCTFDVMLEEFGIDTEPLRRLAAIVRGADTGRTDLADQSSGLLAISLGFSRMYRDDHAQLQAALPIYDALYRWCRDGTEETHG